MRVFLCVSFFLIDTSREGCSSCFLSVILFLITAREDESPMDESRKPDKTNDRPSLSINFLFSIFFSCPCSLTLMISYSDHRLRLHHLDESRNPPSQRVHPYLSSHSRVRLRRERNLVHNQLLSLRSLLETSIDESRHDR